MVVANGASCNVDCTNPPVEADLSITKTDNVDPVDANSPVTYTITVTNNGPALAENVIVSDQLRSALEFTNGVGNQVFINNCSVNLVSGGEDISCDLGDLAANQQVVLEMEVTPGASGTLTNTASANSNTLDPVLGNNSVTETTQVLPPLAQAGCTLGTAFEGFGTIGIGSDPSARFRWNLALNGDVDAIAESLGGAYYFNDALQALTNPIGIAANNPLININMANHSFPLTLRVDLRDDDSRVIGTCSTVLDIPIDGS